MSGVDAVAVIDVSLSMGKGYGDLLPSKLEAAKEAVAFIAGRLLSSRPSRLGVVVFHDRAFPLIPLTSDYKLIIRGLSELDFTGEGSAGGDGIVEAVKMLRLISRRRVVAVITDAGFNAGIPLEAAALYSKNMGVDLTIITVGQKPQGDQRASIESAVRRGARWIHASRKIELLNAVRVAFGVEA